MFPPDSNVLVVDDSSSVRALIKNQLRLLGISQALEAGDGEEAIAELNKHYSGGDQVHLLIVDWRMPKMDGIDLLAQLQNNEKYRGIPFLMISGQNGIDQVAEAISRGVTDYLVKPFNEELLSEKLVSVWERTSRA